MQRDLGFIGILSVVFASIIINVILVIVIILLAKSLNFLPKPDSISSGFGMGLIIIVVYVGVTLYAWYRMMNVPCRYCTADENSPFLDYMGLWRSN